MKVAYVMLVLVVTLSLLGGAVAGADPATRRYPRRSPGPSPAGRARFHRLLCGARRRLVSGDPHGWQAGHRLLHDLSRQSAAGHWPDAGGQDYRTHGGLEESSPLY